MKNRSDDPSDHERTLLPRSYISLLIICYTTLKTIVNFTMRTRLQSIQYDTARHDTTRVTAGYLAQHGVRVLSWPSASPDLRTFQTRYVFNYRAEFSHFLSNKRRRHTSGTIGHEFLLFFVLFFLLCVCV